jgi:hypothetical protein
MAIQSILFVELLRGDNLRIEGDTKRGVVTIIIFIVPSSLQRGIFLLQYFFIAVLSLRAKKIAPHSNKNHDKKDAFGSNANARARSVIIPRSHNAKYESRVASE